MAPAKLDGERVLEALTSLGDDVVIVDAHGRSVYATPAAARLFGADGLGPDPLQWPVTHGLYHADRSTLWAPQELPMVRALAGHSFRDVPMFVRNAACPAGIHVRVSGAAGREGGATFFFRDVAGNSEPSDLAERQRKAILDNIRDMAWLKDREGRFVEVNQAALDMYQLTRERCIGFTDFEVYPSDSAVRFRADDAEVIRSRRQLCAEERVVDATGIVRWLETIKSPVFGANGEVIGTTGTARDITERKEAKEELELRVAARTRELAEAQNSLVRRERLVVLGQLAGGVAHQVRNPLGAIMNATSVITSYLADTPQLEVAESIRIIREEIRHMNVIITELLDFARVRTPSRHLTSMAELVERVLQSEHIPETIVVARMIEDSTAMIDADLIQSALGNMVRNAVEAMPEGGVLGVEVSAGAHETIMAVIDNGPGLSRELREHLFEPLQSTKPRGTGLGLLTARTFVEAHGGSLQAIEVAQGARFEIRLPLDPANADGKHRA